MDVTVNMDKQGNMMKAKATYCKVCFIKTSSEEEADTHEASHNTFRGPDKRWTCIICQHQYSFYCDLLNHFLNHKDILDLYSVYLDNLEINANNSSDNEGNDRKYERQELETNFSKELENNTSLLQIRADDKQKVDHVGKDENGDIRLGENVLKNESNDGENRVVEDCQRVQYDVKLETGEVISEVLDQEAGDSYDDGLNDSDEDKPLSLCIKKKVRKKKKVKKQKIKANEKNKEKKLREKKLYSKVYKCKECQFVSTEKVDFDAHCIVHVEGEPVLCELCDFRCKVKRQLVRHKRLTHEGFKFACDLCEFTSRTKDNLRWHMVVHEDPTIPCRLCGKMFRRQSNLKKHLSNTHTSERPFKCPECPKTFKYPEGYKIHLSTKHNIIRRLHCSVCKFETLSRQELHLHKITMNHSPYVKVVQNKNEKGETVETVKYQCNVCDHVAGTEVNLKHHLRIHGEKKIACEVCGKLFRRLGNLRDHQKSHSEVRPFACPVCPKVSYKSIANYRRHVARHHGMLEMIKCDLCDYKTHTPGELKIHIMKHNGQLRCKCDECSYSCMSHKTLKRHKLVHKNVLPVHKCDLCDFQSVSEAALKRHKRTHVEK